MKKASTGDRSVALYDTEGFTALRKSRALGQVGQGKHTKLHPATYPFDWILDGLDLLFFYLYARSPHLFETTADLPCIAKQYF